MVVEEGDCSELDSLNNSIDSLFVGIEYEVNYCPTPSGPRGHVLVERHLHQKKPSAKKKSLSKCNEVILVQRRGAERIGNETGN